MKSAGQTILIMGLGVDIYTLFSNLLARTFYFVPNGQRTLRALGRI